MCMDDQTLARAQAWSRLDPNETSAAYVDALVEQAKTGEDGASALQELQSLFPGDGQRISFGTAGLRSAMKPGPLGMNDLVVLQTAQGLAKYCIQQHKHDDDECTITIVTFVQDDQKVTPKTNVEL